MSDFRGYPQAGARSVGIDQGLRAYMQKVYSYMAGGLALTGAAAVATFNMAVTSDGTLTAFGNTIFHGPMMWVLILASLGIVMFLSFGIQRMNVATAQLSFWAYAAIMGMSFSSLGLVYTHGSIARVFFITAATFASTSLYGYTTKRDMTGFGSFLFMGLIGIIIASVVNIFLQSTAMNFALSVIGVLLFTGLTAWDTQQIKTMYYSTSGEAALGKSAIIGALRLYLDFINLFMSLLRLFGDRR
ncbi:MAG: Bax inhibitor-1/YccA family protein [Pseudomonadota bacterium]|nr:Bax inhibitor-1/YccA family protein [Pseudomonadota bacterium]